ncbi:MAG: S41 family peptidase [Candidatus Aminicenantes bacterium]|nr:MAG: S41 family peptidase [Candidatus Aminicenantes bacterium]
MKKLCVLFYVLLLSLGNLFAQELSEPERNFERLWQIFDKNYGIFLPKRVDWDLLYKVYRPKVNPKTTDDELFDIMARMLGHLNDNHVRLRSSTRSFGAGILNDIKREGFSLKLVKEKYLKNKFIKKLNGRFHYGWLTDSIGYFHFSGFRDLAKSTEVIDEIVQEFKDCKGIVVDVRFNGGGSDLVGKAIADRFADKKRLYMTTQIRRGPNHDDFRPPKYFYVEPDGPIQFTGPVILLIHRWSVSAADNFALAMRTLPHVTLVGETTSGCQADQYGGKLPNGWRFSCANTLFVDQNGFSWEGIGIPPDIRQISRQEDINKGFDKPLELAIDLMNSGALKKRKDLPKFPIIK